MVDKFIGYVILLVVFLQICLGGYLALFPKKAKEHFSSEKNMNVRMLGVYIAAVGILVIVLMMLCYSLCEFIFGEVLYHAKP